MTEVKLTGRIVQGNPLKSSPKINLQTKQPVLKDGKPVNQWFFAVAVDQAQFTSIVWPVMAAEAAKEFPGGVPPHFSYKYKDGINGVDRNGKPYRERDGWAGCYVVAISSEFPTPVWKWENGAYVMMQDGIKTGDFVTVTVDIVAHKATGGPQNTPGLYINPKGTLFAGYGTEIVGANADPNEMFGAAPVTLAPGASAVPITATPTAPMPGSHPTPPATPGAPPMPAMPPPPIAPAVAPPVAPPAAPPAPPAPPTAYPSSAPPAPPAPPAPTFVPAATDPNKPQFEGYNPTNGMAKWFIPATGQRWEAPPS